MTTKDILDLGKSKKLLNKENLSLLVFAFLCSFGFFISLYWFESTCPLVESSVSYRAFIRFENIFLYPFGILIFLIFYYIGTKLSKVELGRTVSLIIRNDQDFNFDMFSKLFEFQGVLKNGFETQRCLYLNLSSEGLITKRGFNNYKLSFSAKIFYHGFGVILCAKDLENYFMFRINFTREEGLFIIPHIKKYGIWEIQDIKAEREYGIKKIQEGQILEFEIEKKVRTINLCIKDQKNSQKIKEFEYLLPDYFPFLPSTGESETPQNVVSKLEFPKFGKIGFRAWGPDEKTIIYNLEIKKL